MHPTLVIVLTLCLYISIAQSACRTKQRLQDTSAHQNDTSDQCDRNYSKQLYSQSQGPETSLHSTHSASSIARATDRTMNASAKTTAALSTADSADSLGHSFIRTNQPLTSPASTTRKTTTSNDTMARNSDTFHGISTSDPQVAAALGPELTVNDLHNFRLEYNKYKILSNLGILSDLNDISPSIDLDLRNRLTLASAASEIAGSPKSPRRKRSLSCDQVKSNKDTCCLENFYVNFTHIGWDKWILYPAGYNANYCRGQCDLSHARYYHSTLLSKYSNMISLCCSPKQMAPLRLLYIDESNKVHEKSIPDMVVESCDCA